MLSVRIRFLILFISFTFLVACGQGTEDSQLNNIFGHDNREALPQTDFPGRAVGRLDNGCSGAMIGFFIAITAAHCVLDGDTGALKSDLSEFKVGYRDQSYLEAAKIVGVWVGTLSPVAQRRLDWAILWLESDVGRRAGWMGVEHLGDTVTIPAIVNLAGYNEDKFGGEQATIHRNCIIHKMDSKGRLLHDCDAASGISGAPLIVNWENYWNVVGISAAEFRQGEGSMQLDDFSEKFANIGVSSANFLPAASLLHRTIDAGESPPAIANAHYFDNF